MTTIAFVSTKGSPGTTTTALGVARHWARSEPTLLAELDADGGDLAVGCDLSVEDKGLFSLAIAARRDGAIVNARAHCQEAKGDKLPILVSPVDPLKVTQAFEFLGSRLHACLDASDHTVIIDAGRLRSSESTTALLSRVDLVVVVTRPTVEQAVAVEARSQTLKALGPDVVVLSIGDKPYSTDEFASAVGFDVVGVVPVDSRGVEALTNAPDSFSSRRSLLSRSMPGIVESLRSRVVGRVEVSR